MPAYFESGFCVRQPSWHGLENLLDDYPESWDEARLAAGLMWEPVVASALMTGQSDAWSDAYYPRMVQRGEEMPDGAYVVHEQADGARTVLVPTDERKAILRDDTKELLAMPSGGFEIINHAAMGELLEVLTESWRSEGASVKFETAGAVKGGRMVYALVYLDEPWHAPGDDSATFPYAALLNSHDGTGACKLVFTDIRVVCWNTFNAASLQGERTGSQVMIRHTGDVASRLEEAKAGLVGIREEAKEWQMLATDLAGININDAVVRTFLDEFIPVPENASERTRSQRQERQATFMHLYNDSPTVAELPETAYKLVQASGEYLDHLRPFRSADTYLARTIFTPEPVKAGAVRLIRELAHELVG